MILVTTPLCGEKNMIDKRSIEAFLRVNGIPPTAQDEEIRSVLLSAKWNENEVDTALVVLKENLTNQETHVDTLHKVFNSELLMLEENDNITAKDIEKIELESKN